MPSEWCAHNMECNAGQHIMKCNVEREMEHNEECGTTTHCCLRFGWIKVTAVRRRLGLRARIEPRLCVGSMEH